jgi:tripartite-type tricarboxylate transporter receptor subunit TctC
MALSSCAKIGQPSRVPKDSFISGAQAMLSRRHFVAISLVFWVGAALPGGAVAQSYPTRLIKIVVPFPSGGPTDVMARLVAQNLSSSVSQPVIVENRAGAGGTIGAKMVAASDPDGYTLLFGSTSTLAISPAGYKNLDYDPVRSFAPVAAVSNSPLVLVVNPTVTAKTVPELVAVAKAAPGKLNFASAGNGTPPHLTGEMFKASTGLDLVHVPYKGGAPAIQDVVAGQVHMTFEVMSVLLALIQEGKLRALAVTSAERNPQLPDVPTMIESGIKDFQANVWTGVVAPAGTPSSVIGKLNAEINRALGTAPTKLLLAKLGAVPIPGTSEDFAQMLTIELEKWTAIARASAAKAE